MNGEAAGAPARRLRLRLLGRAALVAGLPLALFSALYLAGCRPSTHSSLLECR